MDDPFYPLHRPEIYETLRAGETQLFRAMDPDYQFFPSSDEVVPRGEAHDRMYRLRTGWAARVRDLLDGRRQIIAIFLPGDLVGANCLFLSDQRDAVEALTPLSVNAVHHTKLRNLVQSDSDVAFRVMYQLAEDERRVRNWTVGLGRGSAEERLAMFMLEMRGRLRRRRLISDDTFHLPMKQQQIADCVGLNFVHVNRVLGRFRDTGVMAMAKGTVTIIDVAKLAAIAGPMQDRSELDDPLFPDLEPTAGPQLELKRSDD